MIVIVVVVIVVIDVMWDGMLLYILFGWFGCKLFVLFMFL